MSDNIDAVGMVRRIRDDLYEQTKNMSPAELIEFFRRHGSETREKLLERERQHSSGRGPGNH